MIACLDVQYAEQSACAAAAVIDGWLADTPASRHTAICPAGGAYEPGQFYRRELNPLLAVIARLPSPIDTLVIDAYCTLDADGQPGLGAYLHEAMEKPPAIIGVAKNRFRASTHAAEVMRGKSRRPLFVTAIGIDPGQAAQHITDMHGGHRVPTLLKAVDRLARTGLEAGPSSDVS